MKKLYLLGHPIAHSLSPLIHNTASKALGLDYHYDLCDTVPEMLKSTVKRLKDEGCVGFNLTMPLKKDIIPLLDDMSPQAALSGSVNTVKLENGKMYGHTTDGEGFFEFLLRDGIDMKDKSMVIIGAGGAAASIIAEAATRKLSSVKIYKRKNASFESAEDFFGGIAKKTGTDISVNDIADEDGLREDIVSATLLVNATNVGMAPDIDSTVIDKSFFRKDIIVTDIVYNPLKTRFLKEAEECGCKVYNGTYMLLFQAACAYKLWTGYDMPVETVFKEMEKALS